MEDVEKRDGGNTECIHKVLDFPGSQPQWCVTDFALFLGMLINHLGTVFNQKKI